MQSGELPEGVGQGTTLRQSFVGSPQDIFKQLPRELRITVEDPAEGMRVRSGPCMASVKHDLGLVTAQVPVTSVKLAVWQHSTDTVSCCMAC